MSKLITREYLENKGFVLEPKGKWHTKEDIDIDISTGTCLLNAEDPYHSHVTEKKMFTEWDIEHLYLAIKGRAL